MKVIVTEGLVCLMLASMFFIAYAGIRINWKTRQLKVPLNQSHSNPWEQLGGEFTRATHWFTDSAFQPERRLLLVGLLGAAAAMTGLILLGAATGELMFNVPRS